MCSFNCISLVRACGTVGPTKVCEHVTCNVVAQCFAGRGRPFVWMVCDEKLKGHATSFCASLRDPLHGWACASMDRRQLDLLHPRASLRVAFACRCAASQWKYHLFVFSFFGPRVTLCVCRCTTASTICVECACRCATHQRKCWLFSHPHDPLHTSCQKLNPVLMYRNNENTILPINSD